MSRLQEFTPDSIRQSYARKFGVVLLVLGLLVASVGVVAAGEMQSQLNQQSEDRYQSIAAQEASSIQAWHERNTGLGPAVVRSQDIQSGSQDQIQRGLARWGRRLPAAAQGIHYINYDSETIVASTDDDLIGSSVTSVSAPWQNQDGFRIIASSSSYAGQYITTSYEGQVEGEAVPMVAYVTKVPNVADEYVVIEMRLDQVTGGASGDLEGSSVVLIDDADRVVSQQNYGEAGDGDDAELLSEYTGASIADLRAKSEPGLISGASGPFNGLFVTGSDDVVGYAPVGDTGWMVAVETPAGVAYGSNVARLGLLSTLVGLGMIGAFGLVLGRNTSRSIDELSQKAQQIEEGDFDVDLQSDRIDSVGELYSSFNSMRDTIRENIAATERARFETEQLNEELEQLGAGDKSADEALSAAAERGHNLLREFEAAHE